MGLLSKILGGSGALKSIENIATEWIDTDKETAEAKTLMVKALDPNGKMRRELANAVTKMYFIYLMVMLALIVLDFFGLGNGLPVSEEGTAVGVSVLRSMLTDTFTPITTLFGVIVTSSFGVNYANIKKGA